MVCTSVRTTYACHLSHSCTLLKPLDGMRCHLTVQSRLLDKAPGPPPREGEIVGSEPQGCARGLFNRDRGEIETLKPKTEAETEALTIQAEARPRPRPSELETETRPWRTNSEARPSRGTTVHRDGLKSEALRLRPHPTSTSFQGLMWGKPKTEAEPKWHIQA